MKEQQPSFGGLMQALTEMDDVAAEHILDKADLAIRDVESDVGYGAPSRPAIARHLLYLALASGDDARAGKKKITTAELAILVTSYAGLRADHPALSRILPIIAEGELQRLTGLSTLRQGSRKDRFYAALALLLVQQAEVGAFEHRFFKRLVPASEVALPAQIANYLGRLINEHAIDHDQPVPFAALRGIFGRAPDASVVLGYAYREVDRLETQRLFERYAHDRRDTLRLVLYRPRRTNSTELIKSFATLTMPGADRLPGETDGFSFRHVYQAPTHVGHDLRVTDGWLVPLEEGLYLVGGHHPEPPGDDADVERERAAARAEPPVFRSLEMLFFPWDALRSNLPYGLMVTANKAGVPLITRVCARATLIENYRDLELGAVPLFELAAALEQDRLKEQAHIQGLSAQSETPTIDLFSHFASVENLASRIASLCNNDPTDWRVPAGVERRTRTKSAPAELSKADVEILLAKAFGSDTASLYLSKDGPFSFWSGMRYPPLAAKQ